MLYSSWLLMPHVFVQFCQNIKLLWPENACTVNFGTLYFEMKGSPPEVMLCCPSYRPCKTIKLMVTDDALSMRSKKLGFWEKAVQISFTILELKSDCWTKVKKMLTNSSLVFSLQLNVKIKALLLSLCKKTLSSRDARTEVITFLRKSSRSVGK